MGENGVMTSAIIDMLQERPNVFKPLLYGPNGLRLEQPKALPPRPPPSLDEVEFMISDKYSTHPGHGLTPPRIVQIYRSAEYGWPLQQCDLFADVIERDAHLRSQIAMRTKSVAGKTWIIQAGGDSPADAKAAAMLEERLRLVPQFKAMLEHLLMFNAYGYAAVGVAWEAVEKVFVPTWFDCVDQRRMVFGDRGEPRIVMNTKDFKGTELAPGSWIFTCGPGNIPRSGLMRTATWWSLFKSMSVRDWVLVCERFGIPYPTGRYDEDMTKDEKDILRQAVASLGKDGYAVFSNKGIIETVKTDGNGTPDEVHGPLVSLANTEMSKLFTGATLTSGEGTSTGSYALGRVHENVLFQFTLSDADYLAEIFEYAIGRPFVVWNGLNAKPPRLKINVVRESDPAARMSIYKDAHAMGVAIDEDQFRQDFQLKKPTGAAIEGASAQPVSQGPGAGNSDQNPDDGQGNENNPQQ